MQEVVKDFLEVQKELELEKRQRQLIKVGLCERIYEPAEVPDYGEYPLYDSKAKAYYKNVAIDVTDEEYALLLPYIDGEDTDEETGRNEHASARLITVFTWACWTLGDLVALITYVNTEEIKPAAIVWGIFTAVGMLYYALAEIMKLLIAIKNK